MVGFNFLFWWTTCWFYTAAKQRACSPLFPSGHHWFHVVLTALSYFQHTDWCLPLCEGRSAPRALISLPWQSLRCWTRNPPGLPRLFEDANKQEANWSRPQTPREPANTSTFWPGIRDTEPLYYLSSVELDQQKCITSRFKEQQTVLLAEDQPWAEGTPRVQRMKRAQLGSLGREFHSAPE